MVPNFPAIINIRKVLLFRQRSQQIFLALLPVRLTALTRLEFGRLLFYNPGQCSALTRTC